jgi:hypothetical protein
MSDLARLRIWDDPAIRDSLSWYLAVAESRRPAKFRISASLATQLDPATSSEEALWAELDRLTPIFLARWQAIRAGASLPPAADGPSLLELCRELAYRMLAHCNFCPWNCRVDRAAGTKFGACKLASASRVSSHFHHTGEELFYRGTEGTRVRGSPATLQEISVLSGQSSAQSASSLEVAGSSWVGRVAAIRNLAGLLFSATARYQDRPSRIAGSSQIFNRAKSLMAAAPCR